MENTVSTEVLRKARIRANFSTTTKNEYTLDVTVEIDGVDYEDTNDIAGAIVNIKSIQSLVLEKMDEMAAEKGYSKPISK